MKQRVLVMNGQRLLQNSIEGEWVVAKVDKAGSLKPGIYNIFNADSASRKLKHEGIVLHKNDEFLYQQVSSKIIKHAISNFQSIPVVGEYVGISYSGSIASIESIVEIRKSNRIKR